MEAAAAAEMTLVAARAKMALLVTERVRAMPGAELAVNLGAVALAVASVKGLRAEG